MKMAHSVWPGPTPGSRRAIGSPTNSRAARGTSLRRRGQPLVTLPGESEKALLLGSHLDSVPNGGWLDGCLGVMPASKSCAASRKNLTAARRSPSAWSIGPMKKARASAAVCLARPPSPAPTPSTPTAAAPIATASGWKMHCAAAASRSTAFPKRRRNGKMPPPISNSTLSKVRCSKLGSAARRRAGHQRRRTPRHHLSRPGSALRLDTHECPPRCSRRSRELALEIRTIARNIATRSAPWAA